MTRTAPGAVRPATRPTAASALRVLGWDANETNVELVEAWRSRGIEASLVSPFAARREVQPADVVVSRLDVLPTLDGIEPGLLALLWLERSGVRVRNGARAVLRVHDKLRTAQRLGAAGIPQPRTAAVAGDEEPLLAPPLVLKPRFGSWGRDVFRCGDADELRRTLAEVRGRHWYRRHGAVLQELVPPSGHDLRIVVSAGEVIGAALRVAAAGEWRTNVSLGGSLQAVELPPAARSLALAAAAAVGADFVGVDLMPCGDGHVVLELNGAVEFDHRYSLDGGDVYLEAARTLVRPALRREG